MNVTDALLTWEFLVTAIAINAVMTLFKRMGAQHEPTRLLLAKSWVRAFVLTPLPLALGMLAAMIPDWIAGVSAPGWYLIGITAGFLSNFTYNVFKKRAESSTGVDLDGDGLT